MESRLPSNLVVTNRSSLSLSGVKEVLGYDEMQIEADTFQGMIFIRGAGLKIDSFDSERGELEICGRIDGFVYGEKTEKRSLLSRLFG
ncbi:MAG: sporulation protein YabP [Clostridia bacterium]|nr:sporulation protein YabP [Clostridia bacterium]